MSRTPGISAIVPVLDEEACVVRCLEHLRAAGVGELVVVDGGSSDRTVTLAEPLADTVVHQGGGLACQLNRGAEEAGGSVLLFQYADGLLPPSAAVAIERALMDSRVAGGAFRLTFSSPAPLYRMVAFFAHLRNRCGLGPFGDQSIFMRADVFRRLDGFDPDNLLADHDLVRRMKGLGKFRFLDEPVVTSVRRWEQNGRFRTLLSHWKLCGEHMVRRGRKSRSAEKRLRDLRRVR